MALHKRNPGRRDVAGASEIDQAAKLISTEAKPIHTDKQLIDRFGKRHSETVLVNWSPQMIAAMRLSYADGRPI